MPIPIKILKNFIEKILRHIRKNKQIRVGKKFSGIKRERKGIYPTSNET